MNRTLNCTGVRIIVNAKVERPIVVLSTAQGIDIVRSPKLMLIDLINNGRGKGLVATSLANGIENVSPEVRNAFDNACLDLVGATITGNIIERKAGDEYEITEGHPALTDKAHKLYGKVKAGDMAKAEKDGIYVDGFLTMPLTEGEKMRRDIVGSFSAHLLSLYGFATPAPAPVAVVAEDATPDPEKDASTEGFGNKSKATAATA